MALSAHFNSALNNLALDMYANTYQARMESGAEPPKTREEFLQLFKTMFDVKVKPENVDDDDDVVIIDPPPKVVETVSVEPTQKIDSRDLKKKLASFKFKPEGANRATQMELPYLPNCVDYSHSCQALQFSGGLFSPCLTRGQGICKSCATNDEQTESKYGTIQDREDSEVDKRLKRKKISYGTWCARRGVSREFVESWLKENAPEIVITEEDWVVDTKAVRAPRKKKSEKSASTSSDEETSSVESVETTSVAPVDAKAKAKPENEAEKAKAKPEKDAEKAKAKPEKDAEKAKAKAENEAEKEKAKAENEAEKAKAKAEKEAEKAKAKAEKEAEKAKAKAVKEAEKAKAKAEKEAKKEEKAKAKAEKEAKKEEKAKAKAEKEVKKEEKAMAKAEKEPEKVESAVIQVKKTEKPQEEHDELSDDELDEDEHYEHKFSLDGKNYGVDKENDVFEINEGEPTFVGVWDPETKKPVFE